MPAASKVHTSQNDRYPQNQRCTRPIAVASPCHAQLLPCGMRPCSHAPMLPLVPPSAHSTQQNRECFLLVPSLCMARVAVRRGRHVIVPCTSFCHLPSKSFTGPACGFVVVSSAFGGGVVAEGAEAALAACGVLFASTAVHGPHISRRDIVLLVCWRPAGPKRASWKGRADRRYTSVSGYFKTAVVTDL